MTVLPKSLDRMPLPSRKPRAGPLLDPDEVIATALNGISYRWWRMHPKCPPLSDTSQPVRSVIEGLRMAGYKIVPMEREDFK